VIVILGTPGAGKTTQTRMLADYLGCRWFSMGELIRQAVTGQDRTDMLAGKIISDKTTIGIVDKTLAQFNPALEECVFEGNPRSLAQAEWWLAQDRAGRYKIRAVFHLVADPAIAEQRMAKRGRLDDHDDSVIETRFTEYKRSISPVLNYLKSNAVPIYEVDANNSIDDVAKQIHQLLGV
jgi:adenylate kinase